MMTDERWFILRDETKYLLSIEQAWRQWCEALYSITQQSVSLEFAAAVMEVLDYLTEQMLIEARGYKQRLLLFRLMRGAIYVCTGTDVAWLDTHIEFVYD